ncbi:protein phosphatase 2C domain-containing protein [Streptomyces sp. enrichment culture]|uniref:protein phosphatase 2C domain-containing protein n=1 Tax=Streptomyces sp. enrichment culture TaxID=1795815 RepID=UPI003F5664F1
MSQQGGRPTGHEDDWWGQLYDDSTGDTGPAPAPDSLDDRFASAAGTVGGPGETGPAAAEPVVPSPRSGADDVPGGPRRRAPQRAPWEPPPARATGPVTFPTASRPPGRTEPAPGSPPRPPGPPPPATAVPSRTTPAPPPMPPPPSSAPPGRRDTEPSSPPTADPPRDATPPTAAGWLAPPAPAAPPPAPSGTAASPPAPSGTAAPPPAPSGTTAPPPLPPGTAAPPPVAPAGSVDGDAASGSRVEPPEGVPRARGHVGSRPPTYDAEPTALPAADPDDLGDLVADTVLDGARYGVCTLRAASVRGDSARYRGEPRRDALLTARFGTGEHALLLVAMATGARTAPGAHRAAAEACHWIGRAVGRSHVRLVEDIRGGRRGDLKSGLHRLTDRSLGKLRASASEQGVAPEEYAAGLRCLLLPADPECRTRVFFGVGPGGLFRLREGEWQDIEPQVADVRGEAVVGYGSPPSETPEGDRLTMDLGIPTPPSPYEPAPEPPREPFRFRTSVARPGDTLLMCSSGLAEPLRGEPELGEYLAERWSRPEPPGLAAFLADSQVRVKGYADDRTAAAVWEA